MPSDRTKKERSHRRAEPVRNCCVYVINLKKTVLKDRKLLTKNPHYVKGKPVVYVGQSSNPPEARFQQHLIGIRSSRWVRRYGKSLRTDVGELGLTRVAAQRREAELAVKLRERGWGVWSN